MDAGGCNTDSSRKETSVKLSPMNTGMYIATIPITYASPRMLGLKRRERHVCVCACTCARCVCMRVRDANLNTVPQSDRDRIMPTIVGVPVSGGETGARQSSTWRTEREICPCVTAQSQFSYPFGTQN
jgi:hypothetical protein